MSTYYDDQFNSLIGKKIISIEWDEKTIRFNLIGHSVLFEAIGDCCSSSYIESLDNPEIFQDSTFIGVESVEGETKDIEDWEVHKWTFYKFKTDKGMCTLSFRNESNGYYDGYLEIVR